MQRNSGVAHILVITLALTWGAYSGQLQAAVALLWLAFMALALGLVFPAVKRGATEADARSVAWRRLMRDPFLFLSAASTLFFVAAALNGGRTLSYDAGRDLWAFSPPTWRRGPSSVVPADAWLAAAHACVITAVCLVLRHTAGKRGKELLLQGMSLSSAALALWPPVRGFLLGRLGYAGLPRFLFAADPAAVGAYYLLMAAVSCGLAMDAGARGQFKPWMSLPILANIVGIGLSRSPSAIFLGWAFAVLGGLYAGLYLWPSLSPSAKIKGWLCGVAPVLVGGGVYFCFYPQNPLLQALHAAGSAGAFLDGWVQGLAPAVGAAWRIWRDAPWLGVGAGGFEHFAPLYDLAQGVRSDGRVGLDAVEALCQHGIVGCALLVLAWGVILAGNLRRLTLLRYLVSGSSTRPERWWFFRMTPMAAFLCLGTGLVFILGASGTVFASPFVSFSWCITVTSLGSFLPMRKTV